MYKLLIVDDEPIILSGIKFLIDWEKNDCIIVGTARNGQQALTLIDEKKPDIVICDINMPVMNGLELLKICANDPLAPVFIMLSNLKEFDMARESLRYQAVDYLLKTQMEPETLEGALSVAKTTSDTRKKMGQLQQAHQIDEQSDLRVLSDALRKLFFFDDVQDVAQYKSCLAQQKVLSNYCCLQIMVDYSVLPNAQAYSAPDVKCVFESLSEVLMTLLHIVHKDFALFQPVEQYSSFCVFFWNTNTPEFSHRLQQMLTKYTAGAQNITAAAISFLQTDCFSDSENIDSLREQTKKLRDTYYQTAAEHITAADILAPTSSQLELQDKINHLVFAMRCKDAGGCAEILQQVTKHMEETKHTRIQGIRACVQMFSTVYSVLQAMLTAQEENIFENASNEIEAIQSVINHRQLMQWLSIFSSRLVIGMQRMGSTKKLFLQNVKEYVLEHSDQRIMLQELASHVNLSPSYLSGAFKKEYGQTLVEFINEIKIKRAREIIRDEKCKVYELSYRLGFENSYYFTKVFKKYAGMTPKQYEYKVHGVYQTEKQGKGSEK
ncbi:MAG: response regulator [Oscillospiraceae bacterium]